MIGVYNVYTSFIEAVASLNQAVPIRLNINNVKALSKSILILIILTRSTYARSNPT